MPSTALKKFLDEEDVKYVTIRHSPAFTAQEIAASAHVPGQELAKTVIVRLGGDLAMVVLPATDQVDLERLREVSGSERVELASEDEFEERFPDCETGAMPPFGNLYDMDVYVAEHLAEDDEIAFNAGTHTELIRMSFEDFRELVRPTVTRLTTGS